MVMAIGMDILIKIRQQLQPIAPHKTHSSNLALLKRLIRK